MKNKEFYKLLKKQKANSGFTLTELLVGLIMGTIVIGAMGFGLMQVLQVTQSETSKSAARNEISRAMEFISDELRRAQSIEVDTSLANINTVASNFDPLHESDGTTDIAPVLALHIPGVSQPVIYSVAPPQTNDKWRGPLVIYRWGPTLNSDGTYSTTGAASATTPSGWNNQALIDGVDDTTRSLDCDGDGTPETYEGFYACVTDDDGDGVTEDLTDSNGDGEITADDTGATDRNSDGEINDEDGADVDGRAVTAQLYFTGGVETVSGIANDNYAAETRTVARARTAPDDNSYTFTSYVWSYKDLGGDYSCAGNTDWRMRTDFSTDSNSESWIRDPDRQPQPITINPDEPLTISSIPFGQTNCNSLGNEGMAEDGTTSNDTYIVSHTIDFSNPRTFNGDIVNESITDPTIVLTDDDNNNYDDDDTNDTPLVETKGVRFLKKGSVVPDVGGYDSNNDGDLDDPNDQPTLGKFLYEKGYAKLVNGTLNDPNAEFKIIDPDTDTSNTGYPPDAKNLGDDERIIAFEVGQYQSDNPDLAGFDLQDNIFIVTSDVFNKEYKSCSTGSCSNGKTSGYEVVSN